MKKLRRPKREPLCVVVPKNSWSDLTPWERRCWVRASAAAIRSERWKDLRAGKQREPLTLLERVGVTFGRRGWECGGFRLPWAMDTPEGFDAFRASCREPEPATCGWDEAFAGAG